MHSLTPTVTITIMQIMMNKWHDWSSPRSGYRAPSLQCMSNVRELLFCEESSIFHCRVWYCPLSLCMCPLCMYSMFGHYPHALSYPCAKFCFCHAPPPIAELACGEKSLSYSLTHSPSLFDAPGTEAFIAEYDDDGNQHHHHHQHELWAVWANSNY